MASNEFLSLTNFKSGEPIYIDPATIIQVTQIAQDEYTRRTRIDTSHGHLFIVREEAAAIALATGRGFQDVDPVADAGVIAYDDAAFDLDTLVLRVKD